MGSFEPVVIQRQGGRYAIVQGEERLFEVPAALLETFACDSVFPPDWSTAQGARTPRRLLWNPISGELLMGHGSTPPPKLAELYGNEPFRAYLQVYWTPTPPQLLLHPFWNPRSPHDSFDAEAREESLAVQRRLYALFGRLRPPRRWLATFNAGDRYHARVLGEGAPDAEPVFRVSLAPPVPLANEALDQAFTELATTLAGRCYPTVRADKLVWVESVGVADTDAVRAVLDRHGIAHQDEVFRSH